MLEEFKKFAMRGKVIDLAVGGIIGVAFGAIVNSLVGDITILSARSSDKIGVYLLKPRKRTNDGHRGRSASCQTRNWATKAIASASTQ